MKKQATGADHSQEHNSRSLSDPDSPSHSIGSHTPCGWPLALQQGWVPATKGTHSGVPLGPCGSHPPPRALEVSNAEFSTGIQWWGRAKGLEGQGMAGGRDWGGTVEVRAWPNGHGRGKSLLRGGDRGVASRGKGGGLHPKALSFHGS